MPRVFSASSLETGNGNFTSVSAAPLTIGAWVYSTSLAVNSCVLAITDTAGAINYWLILANATTGDVIGQVSSSGGSTNTNSPGSVTTNTWHHVVYWDDGTFHNCFIDGVGAIANGSVRAPSGTDNLSIGRLEHDTNDFPLTGRAFWPFVYNVILSDNDILMLAKGAYPPTIRRDALVFFPRLLFDEDRDIISHSSLTAVDSPTTNNDRPFQTQFVSGRARNRGRVRMSA